MDASEEFSHVTWLTLAIYVEFMVAAAITIFATVGTAIGQPVVTLFLLALLQFVITVPGCIYNTQRVPAFLILYIGLQVITGLSELAWFITNIIQEGYLCHSIGLGCLFGIQLLSIAIAIFLRDRVVIKQKKSGELETHLSHCPRKKNPSSSLESGVESNRSSKRSRTEEKKTEVTTSQKSKSQKKSKSTKGSRRMAKALRKKVAKPISTESSQSEEIKTRSTQLSVTDAPRAVAVSSIDVSKKRVEQIKKMISEMEDEDKSAKRH